MPLKLKWTEDEFQKEFTKSLQSLKGHYEERSVIKFGEEIVELLKLDEIYKRGFTNETKLWIIRPDFGKPTLNAITHIPPLISKIVLQQQVQSFDRIWVGGVLIRGGKKTTPGMNTALKNLVTNGILTQAEKYYGDGNFHSYHLSKRLFQFLIRRKGKDNGKEKKVKVEPSAPLPKVKSDTPDVIDLTSGGSSDDSNGEAGNNEGLGKQKRTSKISASGNQVAAGNMELDGYDRYDHARKVNSENLMYWPAEDNRDLCNNEVQSNDQSNVKKVDDNTLSSLMHCNEDVVGTHSVLKCKIPWDKLNPTLKGHMITLGFNRYSWMNEQEHLPATFLCKWNKIGDKARKAAAAFGCNELSWNNLDTVIFKEPKLCARV